MTKAEYTAAYTEARKKMLRISRSTMREMLEVYIEAGKMVSAVVRDAEIRNLSELTIISKSQIEQQIEIGANNIRNALTNKLPHRMQQVSKNITDIDDEYLWQFLDGYPDFSLAGVQAVSAAVNERVVRSVLNRLFQDNYTLSDRIWRVGTGFEDDINRVVAAGLAQGRDPQKIAIDVQKYITDGKIILAKRYGPKLSQEARTIFRRISRKVDYRSLRLIRSELGMSLQEAGVQSGRVNPAAFNLFDWILSPNRQQWKCNCPTNAALSPYTLELVPNYDHPNCMCRIQAILRDRFDFISDLKRWVNNGNVGYIDDWYNNIYLLAEKIA